MTALNKQALREAANAANIASWGKWESYKPHKGARGYEVKVGAKAVAQHCLKVDSAFIAAANPPTVLALLDELEAAEKELSACKNILEKIKSTSCHVDTSKGAFIPNSLDAWGRPVPQYLSYDFSGNPGASATQYCNGWNDAGGYWLNHVKYLQECIRAAGIGVKGE
ncbi:ead/Ea22-like family protein [Citrobacter portucalensis]|uniref:ead/Ea22-like family protein n=1 Tax=Citrobacter portucalensis TaxID=1639133 RepID=UPI00351D6621